MVLLGFTKLKEKLLDGSKRQTIRMPRKRPFKIGDDLQVYWKLRTKQCQKLFDAKLTKLVRKKLCEITGDDAVKDGVRGLNEFYVLWDLLHPDTNALTEVDVVTFEKVN